MAQHDAKRIRPQQVILGAAGAVALAAIGWSMAAHRGAAPTSPVENASDFLDPVAATQANPDDPSAWRMLASSLYDQGKFAEAADAYARAAQLLPDEAAVWSALGEARVMASQRDPLPAEAMAAFNKAVALDPADPRARYFLAVKKDLDGDHEGAITDWLTLLADTRPDASWHDDLVRTIEQVGKINKIETASRIARAQQNAAVSMPAASSVSGSGTAAMPLAAKGIPGPSDADLAAASAMRPSEQRAMAENMVARLEGKLKSDPANVDGWVMLMRSRVTLGEPAKAKQALADAVAANPGRAAYLREQAKVLGLN